MSTWMVADDGPQRAARKSVSRMARPLPNIVVTRTLTITCCCRFWRDIPPWLMGRQVNRDESASDELRMDGLPPGRRSVRH